MRWLHTSCGVIKTTYFASFIKSSWSSDLKHKTTHPENRWELLLYPRTLQQGVCLSSEGHELLDWEQCYVYKNILPTTLTSLCHEKITDRPPPSPHPFVSHGGPPVLSALLPPCPLTRKWADWFGFRPCFKTKATAVHMLPVQNLQGIKFRHSVSQLSNKHTNKLLAKHVRHAPLKNTHTHTHLHKHTLKLSPLPSTLLVLYLTYCCFSENLMWLPCTQTPIRRMWRRKHVWMVLRPALRRQRGSHKWIIHPGNKLFFWQLCYIYACVCLTYHSPKRFFKQGSVSLLPSTTPLGCSASTG